MNKMMDGRMGGFINTSLILTNTTMLAGKLGFKHSAVEQDLGLYLQKHNICKISFGIF